MRRGDRHIALRGVPGARLVKRDRRPNAYGTHDWILDYALEGLGERAGWVCRRTALRATRQPGHRRRDRPRERDVAALWDEWGDTWGGAPEAVRVWFGRAQRRLDAGRECAASRALGIMSHFVADVAQPMHTDGTRHAEDGVHAAYESAVDERSEADDDEYTLQFDGADEAGP